MFCSSLMHIDIAIAIDYCCIFVLSNVQCTRVDKSMHALSPGLRVNQCMLYFPLEG